VPDPCCFEKREAAGHVPSSCFVLMTLEKEMCVVGSQRPAKASFYAVSWSGPIVVTGARKEADIVWAGQGFDSSMNKLTVNIEGQREAEKHVVHDVGLKLALEDVSDARGPESRLASIHLHRLLRARAARISRKLRNRWKEKTWPFAFQAFERVKAGENETDICLLRVCFAPRQYPLHLSSFWQREKSDRNMEDKVIDVWNVPYVSIMAIVEQEKAGR